MLFRRLEPNLIVSYDMPEGLGMVLRLGKAQDMQRRLSRVPGEEISTANQSAGVNAFGYGGSSTTSNRPQIYLNYDDYKRNVAEKQHKEPSGPHAVAKDITDTGQGNFIAAVNDEDDGMHDDDSAGDLSRGPSQANDPVVAQ